jgi:predicted TIM-barrel fold metal-dependent hydrolase
VLAEEAGATGKILFGSHFPFETPQAAIEAIYSVNALTHGTELPTVSRESLTAIIQHDAVAALGIPDVDSDSGGGE